MFQDNGFKKFKYLNEIEKWFKIKVKIDKDYPVSAPKIKFLTKMFHPNIL